VARLKLSLLGPFQVLLDGEIVSTFHYDKVRALLAYLAAESEHPQRREVLADLLWPGWSQVSALRNLSSALANLRKVIGDRDAHPPFLLISRDSLQLDRESNSELFSG
jgi:DNA-binding SARP family transcriptional activator